MRRHKKTRQTVINACLLEHICLSVPQHLSVCDFGSPSEIFQLMIPATRETVSVALASRTPESSLIFIFLYYLDKVMSKNNVYNIVLIIVRSQLAVYHKYC